VADKFFDEQAEQSAVKTAIVSKYFWAWAKVITAVLNRSKKDTRLAYIDLFAGPGRYKDGAKSTPLMILEQAIQDPVFHESFVTWFNDKEKENTSVLAKEIGQLPGIKKLKHPPRVFCNEIGTEIVKMFEKINLVPTLFFVDPWGYKGLSLRLINSILKDWGCECIFLFNYNRVNMGINNEIVKEHMESLLGEARATKLRSRLEFLKPSQREFAILEEICEALVEMGGKFILPFCFKNEQGTRTSHHLIFVSKHPLGYSIMKEVMAKESSSHEQGVPTFEYNNSVTSDQPLLFELARPLDDLEEMLLAGFAGKTLKMIEVFERHNYGRRYIKKNYKDALTRMEVAGKITGNPPSTKRKKIKGEITCADETKFTFPPKERET
jgi:three-Cys-motif partner protein